MPLQKKVILTLTLSITLLTLCYSAYDPETSISNPRPSSISPTNHATLDPHFVKAAQNLGYQDGTIKQLWAYAHSKESGTLQALSSHQEKTRAVICIFQRIWQDELAPPKS